jgi:hypothetical protein
VLVEIRSYRLKPDTYETFARLFEDEALPLLAEAGIDVVAFGGSPADPDAAFLIRSFVELADRDARELAFYGSPAWRLGPREAILACIDTYTDTLLTLDERTVDGMRVVGVTSADGRT